MKPHKAMSALLMVILFALSMPRTGTAQRIYDKERDDQAQAAKKLADEVKSGALWDKQIKNLGVLSRESFATYFMGFKAEMRTGIQSLSTWADVNDMVDAAEAEIVESHQAGQVTQAEADKKRRELEDKISEARRALKQLAQTAEQVGDPSLTAFFNRVGDFEALQEFAEKVLNQKGNLAVVDRVTNTLDVLKNLYDTYNAKLKQIQSREKELQELKVPLAKVNLQALLLEEEHEKNKGAIEARREAEQDDVRRLARRYRNFTTNPMIFGAFDPNEKIVDTLRRVVEDSRKQPAPYDTRRRLYNIVSTLYMATALTARGSTPGNLAALRSAQEEHLYSIRRSALMARAYELTVSTGVQRLALYHQGGMKPEFVAQLIYTAATVAIPPAILAK